MSSDRKEPGATWQSTPNTNRTQPPDSIPPQHVKDDYPLDAEEEIYAYDADSHNALDTPFPPEQGTFLDEQEMEEESDIAADLDANSASDSSSQRLWRYITLIVFPLLFFGITFLLIFATKHDLLLFAAIVLLLIAIGQGAAVYLAGPHHNMWILGTLGGFLLFVLFGVFMILGPIAGTVLLIAFLAGCVYLARRCLYSVVEGSVDIVYTSGKYTRTLSPGLHLVWPWEEVRHQVNIGGTTWICPPQEIQLSHEDNVSLRAEISYQVIPEDAYLAVTETNNWEESLRDRFVTILQTTATQFKPTDFLAWPQSLQAYQAQISQQDPQNVQVDNDDFSGGPARREYINAQLLQKTSEAVAPWGIDIHRVSIRDIKLIPHTLAAISTPPIMPDYIQEEEFVTRPTLVQSASTQGNGGQNGLIGHAAPDEVTEVLPQSASSTPSPPVPPQKIPSEEVLKKVYNEVKNGKVTDPHTIRQLAAMFDAVARDPELSQKVSFDPERAAANLREQAQHQEDAYRSSTVHGDVTKPDLRI